MSSGPSRKTTEKNNELLELEEQNDFEWQVKETKETRCCLLKVQIIIDQKLLVTINNK